MADRNADVLWFENLAVDDVAVVGGKNASLGEMIRRLQSGGIRVPDGFATTAAAYRRMLDANQLNDPIRAELEAMNGGNRPPIEVGRNIRRMLMDATLPDELQDAIRQAYRELSRRYGQEDADVAVRSSATAEDLPSASFAGQTVETTEQRNLFLCKSDGQHYSPFG